MNRTPLLLLFILAFIPALSPTFAAEEESDDEAATQTTPAPDEQSSSGGGLDNENEEAEQEGDLTNAENPEDENFVPSIQITEDLPVAFPVDI